MTTPTTTSAATPAQFKAPSWFSLTRDRTKIELKEFFRSREQMIFIFSFPLIFMVLFGSIFGGQDVGQGVSFAQYFMAGMIASGIMNTGFQSLALGLAIDRDEDILKRIHGTPLPASAFFAGKVTQVLLVSILQILALVALGVVAFDVEIPKEPGQWFTFVWVFILGTGASTTMGIATSSILRNSKSGSAILTPIVLFLQFISGVFVVYTQVPTFLQHVAEIFPLKWLAQGMRSVFLPEEFAAMEARGSWEHPATAIVLSIWFIAGTLLAIKTFRWLRPDDK